MVKKLHFFSPIDQFRAISHDQMSNDRWFVICKLAPPPRDSKQYLLFDYNNLDAIFLIIYLANNVHDHVSCNLHFWKFSATHFFAQFLDGSAGTCGSEFFGKNLNFFGKNSCFQIKNNWKLQYRINLKSSLKC